jgi:DNA-binding phage protein
MIPFRTTPEQKLKATKYAVQMQKAHLPVEFVAKVLELAEALIDRHGAITKVARKAGIPQPSLSRMLNSASMPRRTTLYKIAKALDLDESEIVTEWVR